MHVYRLGDSKGVSGNYRVALNLNVITMGQVVLLFQHSDTHMDIIIINIRAPRARVCAHTLLMKDRSRALAGVYEQANH